MNEWVLIISLMLSNSGKAQSTIDMASRETCEKAVNNFVSINAAAYCLSRKTGEVFGNYRRSAN